MTGVAQVGAQEMLNHLTRAALPVISNTAPTWIPGMSWVNTTTNPPLLYKWNGTTWTQDHGNPIWLALLTADPTGLVNISQLTECTDAGYSRQPCAFSPSTATSPVTSSNSSLIQFGPFTVNMALPVQWAALVDSSSGTSGFLRETWTFSTQEQVLATETVDIAAGQLVITES